MEEKDFDKIGDFKTKLKAIQGLIKNNEIRVKKLLKDPVFKADNLETSKMKSDITLSYCRLEDVQILLEKVIRVYEESAAAYALDWVWFDEPP